ncbi:MAG: phosphatidylglycerophosphatase A [Burkholderiaceae bacterium]|nr:phosphatidylglycerophosphatase A [Burkholderiaceae bacterium]
MSEPEPALIHPRPSARFMLSRPWHVLAQGFGSGLSPIMPGTAGTLFGWLVYAVLTSSLPEVFTPTTWGMLIVVGFVLGIPACAKTGAALGVHDHGSLVWDEVIAIWLVLLFLTPSDWKMQACGFVLFRFFDMVKPPPIRYFDQHVKGGFGVMWDDIVAAFYTLLAIALWRVNFS